MSNKHDKTVPAEADDYKKNDDNQDEDNIRRIDHDPLVREAKSNPRDFPNRDEDEFTGKGLESNDTTGEAEEEGRETTENPS